VAESTLLRSQPKLSASFIGSSRRQGVHPISSMVTITRTFFRASAALLSRCLSSGFRWVACFSVIPQTIL